jgi:hypothetical protein
MNTNSIVPGSPGWFAQQEEIAAREARIAENQRIFAQRVAASMNTERMASRYNSTAKE